MLLLLAAAAAGAYFYFLRPPAELVLTGVVTTDELIVAPEIQGRLQSLGVAEGDFVTNGQLLACIRPEQWRADAAHYASSQQQTTADLAQARADFENALLSFDRIQGLYSNHVESAQACDAARALTQCDNVGLISSAVGAHPEIEAICAGLLARGCRPGWCSAINRLRGSMESADGLANLWINSARWTSLRASLLSLPLPNPWLERAWPRTCHRMSCCGESPVPRNSGTAIAQISGSMPWAAASYCASPLSFPATGCGAGAGISCRRGGYSRGDRRGDRSARCC